MKRNEVTKNFHVHQFVDRDTKKIVTEEPYADKYVKYLYSNLRENQKYMFNIAISPQMSSILAFLNYSLDSKYFCRWKKKFIETNKINFDECVDKSENLNTTKKIFERKIRYWDVRPMPSGKKTVVSPCDAKMLVGSISEKSLINIKNKFFSYEELFGVNKVQWLKAFQNGAFAVFRLTPEKYHYNHAPVSGIVRDIYEIDGEFHSCNPAAVVRVIKPYSKNKRVVTIIDTDVRGGSGIGLVAMIEVVALMIGKVEQVYSEYRYDLPKELERDDFIKIGQPKSKFAPGSSTVVLFFQEEKVKFDDDIIENLSNFNAVSRFSVGFKKSLVETNVYVRSKIAVGR